eukprot:544724_1
MVPFLQILDKIHCYFQHTFDIGYKLTSKERLSIINDENEQKLPKFGKDKSIMKMTSILKQKNKNLETNTEILNVKRINKYTQLHSDYKETDQMYNYGMFFKYDGACGAESAEDYSVSAKYSSLKQELTAQLQALVRMSIQQFNNEYAKAKIHFNSSYRHKGMNPFFFVLGKHSKIIKL